MYVPLSQFGAVQNRSDVGGGSFVDISGITSRYTTGLCQHSGVFRLKATVLEGLEGQVVLTGTSAIPQPTFNFGGSNQTQTGTLNSTTSVTGLTSTTTLVPGMPLSGANIQAGTTIAAITSGTAITLSQAATGSGSSSLTFYSLSGTTGTLTAGSTAITGLTSTATLIVGMAVSAVGLVPDTVITSITSGTAVAINNPAITSGSASVTFYSTNDGAAQANPNSPPVFVGGSVGTNSMFFNPLRLSFKVNVSNQLLRQSPAVFVPILREQISRGVGSMLDNLALFGTGPANGQPAGLFTAVTPVNFAATAMTWAQIKTYQSGVLSSDLAPDSFGVLMSPAMFNYLDQTQVYSGASYSLYEKLCDSHPDRVVIENSINPTRPMATVTTQSGTLTSGSVNVTGLTSTAALYIGMPVSGTNVPANTTIAGITSATAIALSQAATGTGSQTLTFTAAKGLFLGLWKFLYVMIWTSGLEVVFDRTTNADFNQTIVRCNLLANVGTPRPNAFAALYQS